MIMQRQPDGTYTQIGFIRTPTEDIDKIVDRNGDVYFKKGFIRQITSTPPLSLDAIGKPIISYKIYGNTVQNGTPTPESPVEVQGVGNLQKITFDTPLYGDGTVENSDTCDLSTGIITRRWGVKVFDGTEDWTLQSINKHNIANFETQLVANGSIQGSSLCTHFLSNSSGIVYIENESYTITAKGVLYVRVKSERCDNITDFKSFLAAEYAKGTPVTVYYPLAEPTTETIEVPAGLTGTVIGNMTQDGTPTPETPVEVSGLDKYDYGCEIPVVVSSENHEPITTSIFLDKPLYKGDYIIKDKSGGKVHREWGVKVFDGTENFSKNSPNNQKQYMYYCSRDTLKAKSGGVKCTHLPEQKEPPTSILGISNGTNYNVIYFNFGEDVMNAQPSGNTVEGFKELLASEYAKGTPVTVYYPLAEPTEESIKLPEITTFDGTTIIETDTQMQPENIEITYKSRR